MFNAMQSPQATQANKPAGAMARTAAALCAAAALSVVAPVHAGSAGGFGGSLEVTQIHNNIELMAQVGESMTQTATQINQLSTMISNLQDLSNLGAIAERLGLPMGSIDTFIKAYGGVQGALRGLDQMERAVTRFGKSAAGTVSFYSNFLDQMGGALDGSAPMSQGQIMRVMRQMSSEQRDQARAVLARRMETIQDMKNDYQFIQDNAKQIGEITGNVQGFQFLASQQSGIQRMLLDQQMITKQIALQADEDRVRAVEMAEAEAAATTLRLQRSLDRMR